MGGRIKLVPLNLYVGYDMAKKDFTPEKMEQLTHHPKPLKTSVYHLLFPKALAESESRSLSENALSPKLFRIVKK